MYGALPPVAFGAPRRFALCDVELQEDGWHEAVGWGLDFGDRAVVYLRNPHNGHALHGVFSSAEQACRRLSRVGPLQLVWT